MSDIRGSSAGWRGTDGDSSYLDKTLRYEATETLFDDSVKWHTLFTVWYESSILSVVVFVFFVVLWFLSGGIESLTGSAGSQPGSNILLTVGLALSVATYFLIWLLFLATPQRETISEWRVLLAGRAAAADSVYSHIVGLLRDRQMPISGQTRRTLNDFGTTNNRLVLVDGHYEVYVSVFAYGTSLYLGWTMWRARRGGTLVAQFLNDRFATRAGQFSSLGRAMRTERPKAMREAVHGVCREALHNAVQLIEVPQTYGFPRGLPPIEGLPNARAPWPGVVPQWRQSPLRR